jgi:uncharacterized cupin superfamily protein
VQDGIARTRLDLEGQDRFQRLRADLGVSAFGLNLIRLDPGQRGRIHAHERQEEVYVVLRGTLTLIVEGDAHELGPDEAVRVAPALKRQLVNLGEERVVLLALGGAGEHQGRDGIAYEDWSSAEGVSPQQASLPPDLSPEERAALRRG